LIGHARLLAAPAPPASPIVIASEAKQSSLDCFVAALLAKTVELTASISGG
jgi:hypothetical protein